MLHYIIIYCTGIGSFDTKSIAIYCIDTKLFNSKIIVIYYIGIGILYNNSILLEMVKMVMISCFLIKIII